MNSSQRALQTNGKLFFFKFVFEILAENLNFENLFFSGMQGGIFLYVYRNFVFQA